MYDRYYIPDLSYTAKDQIIDSVLGGMSQRKHLKIILEPKYRDLLMDVLDETIKHINLALEVGAHERGYYF